MENSGGVISLVLYESASVTLQIVSMVFNVAILCTLSKASLIRCPSNKFVFSLCMSHLIIAILSLLISAIQFCGISGASGSVLDSGLTKSDLLAENIQWPVDTVLSHFIFYFTLIAVVGSSINVALISVERYITIANPMKYKCIVTQRRCIATILICWILPILAILLPVCLIGNETVIHGSFVVPIGGLGLYYAILFSCVTFIAVSVMIMCYLHIFVIAKAKCQKVQIGHFTSPVSSISSDWPSTAYSSQAEGHPPCQFKYCHPTPPAVTGTQRLSSPNSLLQYVLLSNLGRHSHTPLRESYALTLQNDTSPEAKSAAVSSKATTGATYVQTRLSRTLQMDQQHGVKSSTSTAAVKPRRWQTFIKQNYNSPRKTVSTIVILIGSLILTQLPLSVALYFPTQGFSLFYFCFKHLFPFSSIANPVLYGFLNRAIRVHLLKLLRVKSQSRGFTVTPKNRTNCRKASFSSADGHFLKREASLTLDEDKPSLRCTGIINYNHKLDSTQPVTSPILAAENNIKNDSSEEHVLTSSHSESENNLTPDLPCEGNTQCNETEECAIHVQQIEDLHASNFPRKPSQDSGVDVAFSEDEEEEAANGESSAVAADSEDGIQIQSMALTLTHGEEENKSPSDETENGESHATGNC